MRPSPKNCLVKLLFLISTLVVIVSQADEAFEPYKVLGIHRRSTAQEIRKV